LRAGKSGRNRESNRQAERAKNQAERRKSRRIKPSVESRFMPYRVEPTNFGQLTLHPHAHGKRDYPRNPCLRVRRRDERCHDDFALSRQSPRSKSPIHIEERHNGQRCRAIHGDRGWEPPEEDAFQSSSSMNSRACLMNFRHLAVKMKRRAGCVFARTDNRDSIQQSEL